MSLRGVVGGLLAALLLVVPVRSVADDLVFDFSRAELDGLSINPIAMMEGAALFLEARQIYQNVQEREARHVAELKKRGIAEVPPSQAAIRYRIEVSARRTLLLDDWGEIFVDRRFLTEDELDSVKRMEDFIWKNIIVPLQQAKAVTVVRTEPPPPTRSRPKTKTERLKEKQQARQRPKPPPPVKRQPRLHAGTAGLPVFRGFEDARYQEHDELIARLTAEFNADKAKWCGGSDAQAAKIADLTPAMVKAHMIEESGGNGPRSKAAWTVDPLQVNVPGDWGSEKELVGLVKPSRRNEGTAENNVRAAIMYLARKGFGASARPAAERPDGFFDGWPTAYTRYNGRRDRTETDRYYSEEYADKILKRAENPDVFVPIEIKLAQPK